jgi:3-methyladenine DNA glycosylase AlkD
MTTLFTISYSILDELYSFRIIFQRDSLFVAFFKNLYPVYIICNIDMSKYLNSLISELDKSKDKKIKHPAGDSYLGGGSPYYGVSTPVKRKIAKDWANANKDISVKEYVRVLTLLFKGESYEEKTVAGLLLGYLPEQREIMGPKYLDSWLNYLEGWSEIDSLCYGNFSAEEILDNWFIWKSQIRSFSKSGNISKRRASLVLLTAPVRNSDNNELSKLAFNTVDRLKGETDVLITKAVSWLLRELIKKHRGLVSSYLDSNEKELPRIAVREVRNKLKTGKK